MKNLKTRQAKLCFCCYDTVCRGLSCSTQLVRQAEMSGDTRCRQAQDCLSVLQTVLQIRVQWFSLLVFSQFYHYFVLAFCSGLRWFAVIFEFSGYNNLRCNCNSTMPRPFDDVWQKIDIHFQQLLNGRSEVESMSNCTCNHGLNVLCQVHRITINHCCICHLYSLLGSHFSPYAHLFANWNNSIGQLRTVWHFQDFSYMPCYCFSFSVGFSAVDQAGCSSVLKHASYWFLSVQTRGPIYKRS